jgi:hypothetical protein
MNPAMKRSFDNDRQHFSQNFRGGQGGSTGRSGETLDGFSFVIRFWPG